MTLVSSTVVPGLGPNGDELAARDLARQGREPSRGLALHRGDRVAYREESDGPAGRRCPRACRRWRRRTAAASPAGTDKPTVSVLSEFKVHEKKHVPFTDANMDIPRGINDVQPYYIIGADEIENSGKTDLDDVLRRAVRLSLTVQVAAAALAVLVSAAGRSGRPACPRR